jgi:hypothetical protein
MEFALLRCAAGPTNFLPYRNAVGPTGEGLRHSDLLGSPHEHKAIGCI